MGFILAASGSAIGLGNIWRFPYVVGEGGGAAFVLIYLGFVFLIGAAVMLGELEVDKSKQVVDSAWDAIAVATGVTPAPQQSEASLSVRR